MKSSGVEMTKLVSKVTSEFVKFLENSIDHSNRVTEASRRKNSEAHLGRVLSEETKRKISEAHLALGSTITEEGRRRLSEAAKGHTHWVGRIHSEETKRRMSEAALARGSMLTEDGRRRLSKVNEGNTNALGYRHSERAKQLISDSLKSMWASMPQEEKDRLTGNTARASKRGPTEPEWFLGLCLEKHWPGEWAYNGNGEQGVTLNSRTSDFVNINGLKAVIEVFGSHHHDTYLFPKKDTPEELIARYAELGFKCLVLWDYECYDDSRLVGRISNWLSKNPAYLQRHEK